VWCEPEVVEQAAWEFDVSNTYLLLVNSLYWSSSALSE
jgi:hypothetical protein